MALEITASKSFPNFRTAFCAHCGCSDESFAEECFGKSVDSYLHPLVALVRLVRPRFFRPDLDYLELVGNATTWREFAALAKGIRRDAILNRGLLCRRLHLRISGGLLFKLREEMISPSRR